MILDKHAQKSIENNPEKFRLNIQRNNQPTWEDYVEQYRYIIFLLAEKGKEKKYSINPISRPFLFLLRHYFELLLKKELISEGINPIREHDFNEIFKQYDDNGLIISDNIKNAISCIDFDKDGTCYRYYRNLDGEVCLRDNSIIEVHKLFEEYLKLPSSYKELISTSEFDKRLVWEFTCHMHEVSTQAQIRTQYDLVISYILKLIIEGSVNIGDIYLPLLFLVRHSIELALKDNAIDILVLEIDEIKRNKMEAKIKVEHSLFRLYNIFNQYLSQIPIDNIDIEFKKRTNEFYEATEKLKNIIHQLDSNSRQFRYIPENNGIKIENNAISDALTLYTFTDPFLTFVIDVFKENSLIPYTDKELADMFGYY